MRLLQRDEQVAHRVVGRKAWEQIKRKWFLIREEDKGDQLLEAKRLFFIELSKYRKFYVLIQWLKSNPSQQEAKSVYEEINLRWHDDEAYRVKQLQKALNKSKEMIKKHKRRVDELQPDDEDTETQEPFSLQDFNEALASLELVAGFTIDNYDTLPLGKYEAMNKVTKRRADARERSNNRT